MCDHKFPSGVTLRLPAPSKNHYGQVDCFLVARSGKLFCQKLNATQNRLLVYGIRSVFDSLLVNQLNTTCRDSSHA